MSELLAIGSKAPAFSAPASDGQTYALAERSERDLVQLFRQSQPAWTAPESAYGAR